VSRILIADDDQQNRYMLQSLLEGNGHVVVTTANGAEALDIAATDAPEILITDVLMPIMDGFTLCRHWKSDARFRHIPVIVYTATYTDEKDEELALSLGADRFVVKPQEPDAFLETLAGVLTKLSEGGIAQPRECCDEEETLNTLYNEALVRKLEDKMLQLEKANKALTEAGERYRSLLDIAHDAVFIADVGSGEVMDCNQSAEQLLGRTRDQIIGMRQRDVHPPGEAERYEQLFQDRASSGSGLNPADTHVYHADGYSIPVEISAGVSMIAGHKVIVGIFRDLRERFAAQQKISRTGSLLDATGERTADGILIVDMEGTVVHHNRRFAQLWNLPENVLEAGSDDALLAFVSDQLKDPDDFLAKVKAVYGSPGIESFDLLALQDGRIFERYSRPHRADDVFVGRVWIFRDVTRRVKTEKALRDSEFQYRELFTNVPIGMYRTTPDGQILISNPAAGGLRPS